MRIVPFLISAAVTGALIYGLSAKWGSAPRFGPFLSPQHGFWQNAEATNADFNDDLHFPNVKGKIDVILDERLVPHIFAENDEDAYYAQGYLHAKFRLFQMDIQTKAAEGRASEIAGEKALDFDREQRYLGMRFAAENALKEIEKDPQRKAAFDAYTNGVNDYISNLKTCDLPLEYKILDIRPEKWSNIRTALLLKMMAKMLSSGTENDMQYSLARKYFTEDELKLIYPQVQDSLIPIVPKGTVFGAPGATPVQPIYADSLYIQRQNIDTLFAYEEVSRPDANNGSNNWVVSGSKTADGNPILCNDPHLELSLPSIWFEQQIVTPTSNTYGVSLPGSPFVIIGFNDSIAWGVTNAQRDVKDYYKVRFKDDTKKEYWFNGHWEPVTQRIEEIKIRGGKTVFDTIPYTIYGPTRVFGNSAMGLSVRWVAHDPSNEGLTFYKLNRAHNYNDYLDAISTFVCPAQNFVFASRSGDIAIWQQGKFPARWDRQGMYPMPGEDSSYMWQGFIPQQENPHMLNPEQGFLQSANQRPVDSAYPYFIPGTYITPRGVSISNKLSAMNGITPQDMMKLQNDYFNSLAEDARPLLLKHVNTSQLDEDGKRYVELLRNWDLNATPESQGQTVFQVWWDSLETSIWADELMRQGLSFKWPDEQTTLELLARDSALIYYDDINTAAKETIADMITLGLIKATPVLKRSELNGQMEWWKFKDPTIYHLLKEPLIVFARKGLKVGGNGNIINAITHSHGPSWRMVVNLGSNINAYGVYPGGQNGNPGSRYYDMFVDDWATGNYYQLWFMTPEEKTDKKAKWKMTFTKP